MKGFAALGLLILAGTGLASPLGKNIKDVAQKREAQDDGILNYALTLEYLEADVDADVDVKPREISPVRL